MGKKTHIVVVDDHPLFREGLKTIIGRNNAYEVVGEAGNSRQALQITSELKPDLALVDMSLPDQSGVDLVRDILKASPKTRILIVSMHSKIDYIVKAFQAGAMGYIVKESAADMLLSGIDHVLKGDYFMDTKVSEKVVSKLVGLPKKTAIAGGAGYDALTHREQEVMALLVQGMSTSQIADRLFISPKTVENHRANVMRKLKIRNITELIRYAAKIGIIDTDLWKE